MVNLRVMSGATLAFSTNRGAHCISMYTADSPSGYPSWSGIIKLTALCITFQALPVTGDNDLENDLEETGEVNADEERREIALMLLVRNYLLSKGARSVITDNRRQMKYSSPDK